MGILVKTKPYGEIEVTEDRIIDFPYGVLGFDYIKKFVLLDSDEESSPFSWLQAFDEPNLAFILMSPTTFLDSYDLLVSQSDLAIVEANKDTELLVFAIITIPADPSLMTANLQGPIIINKEKQLGLQAISLVEKYGVKHKVLQEIQTEAAEA